MAITSGFFNSLNGDRTYNADDMSNYFEGIVSDGVYESVGDRLAVTAAEGMAVNVGTGRALIDCKWIRNDATYQIQISAADVQLKRIDAVVIKLDITSRTMSIDVVKGTPSTNWVQPVVTNTSTAKYLILATVKIGAGVTSINSSNIVDMRGSTRCPWVTGVIKQVDTSDLFLQYQTAYEQMKVQMELWQAQQQSQFETWFNGLTESLHVDTSLKKYQYTYRNQTGTTTIPLIEQYEDGDILLVHIGGVLFIEGNEYSIDTNAQQIVLVNDIKANNLVTQILIKSEIGQDAIAQKVDEINGEVI